jgi:hypothetical protein
MIFILFAPPILWSESKDTGVQVIKLPMRSIKTNFLELHLYKRHPNGSEKVSKREYKGRVNEAQMNETLS